MSWMGSGLFLILNKLNKSFSIFVVKFTLYIFLLRLNIVNSAPPPPPTLSKWDEGWGGGGVNQELKKKINLWILRKK